MDPLLAIAIAPVAFLLIYIYEKDVIAKEPKSALIKAFCGGAFLTVIAVFITNAIWTAIFTEASEWENPILSAFGQAFLEAALPEEFFKFLVLYALVWKSKDFDENFDGIVYAVFVSMGFACTENIMYTFENGEGTGIMRAFTAVPGHFFDAVIMGYYFSLAKFTNNTRNNLLKSLFYAVIAHGIYDMILFLMQNLSNGENDSNDAIVGALFLAFFAFNFFLWRLGFKRIKELRNMDIDLLPDDHPQKRNFYMRQCKSGGKRISLDKPNNPRTRMMSQKLQPGSLNNRFNNQPNLFNGNDSINMGIPTNPMSRGIPRDNGNMTGPANFQSGYPQNHNFQQSPSMQSPPIQLDQTGLQMPQLHAQSRQQPRFSENITTPISVKEFNESQQLNHMSHTVMTPTPNNRPYNNDNHPENDFTQPNAMNPGFNAGSSVNGFARSNEENPRFDNYQDDDNSETVSIPVDNLGDFDYHPSNNRAFAPDPFEPAPDFNDAPYSDHIDYSDLSIDGPLPTIKDSPAIPAPNQMDLADHSVTQRILNDIPPLSDPDADWTDSPIPTFKELSPIAPPPNQGSPFATPSLVLKDLG